ncbi:MAG: toprim domain-containing protein [Candidatus Marinimicrobia bacterium]|nr:toprim domain-containing protein [Candidatus Neomarinimicrobiota bacterium]
MTIDFERIKRELPIKEVLTKYGLLRDLKQRGSQLYGPCPLHGGDNPQAFNVSLEKNLWNCFTHCRGGSVVDLLMALEKVDVREAGKLGYEMLGVEMKAGASSPSGPRPLDFTLSLDYEHPYLKSRNIDLGTAKYFGVGHCDRGIMAGRIAIPIHDDRGKLVAYAGRAIDDEQPKYRFPRGFSKNKVVYNLNRVRASSAREIVVVEGFFDVMTLYRSGIESVGLMGSSLSKDQRDQLLSLEQRLTLCLDGDNAGRRGMAKALEMLRGGRPMKAVYLPEGLQPEDFGSNYLREILS